MEALALAGVLLALGLPLAVFGLVVSRRRFDLALGDLTAENTERQAWDAAHRRAGRGFTWLGALLCCAAPLVAVSGRPGRDWIFGVAMAATVLGLYAIGARAVSRVSGQQRTR